MQLGVIDKLEISFTMFLTVDSNTDKAIKHFTIQLMDII